MPDRSSLSAPGLERKNIRLGPARAESKEGARPRPPSAASGSQGAASLLGHLDSCIAFHREDEENDSLRFRYE